MVAFHRKVMVHELENSNFTRTASMARFVRGAGEDENVLRAIEMLDGDSFETVIRAKPDGSNRWGIHMTCERLAKWAQLFEAMMEAYVANASEFDGESVFWRVIEPEIESELKASEGAKMWSWRKKWSTKIIQLAKLHGGWIGCTDIKQFFGHITPNVVLDTLGREGVGLEPRLVDAISTEVSHFGELGIPHSSWTSDLLARLVLVPLDRRLSNLGIPYVRWQDDIYVFGDSREQVRHFIDIVVQELKKWKFEANRSKNSEERPERLFWVSKGIIWGDIPIEYYETRFTQKPDGSTAEPTAYGESGNRRAIGLDHYYDFEAVYADYFEPGRTLKNHTVQRQVIEAMGRNKPEVLRSHLRDLVHDRPAITISIVKGVGKSSWPVASECIEMLPDRSSKEDDGLQILENCRGDVGFLSLRQLTGEGVVGRAQRQGMMGILSATEESYDAALKSLSPNAWSDEVATLADLGKRVSPTASKVAKMFLEKKNSAYGSIFEVLEKD